MAWLSESMRSIDLGVIQQGDQGTKLQGSIHPQSMLMKTGSSPESTPKLKLGKQVLREAREFSPGARGEAKRLGRVGPNVVPVRGCCAMGYSLTWHRRLSLRLSNSGTDLMADKNS